MYWVSKKQYGDFESTVEHVDGFTEFAKWSNVMSIYIVGVEVNSVSVLRAEHKLNHFACLGEEPNGRREEVGKGVLACCGDWVD